MSKKIFIIFAISLLIVSLSTICFAAEDNMMNKDNIKNTIINAENSITNGVTSAINNVSNMASNAVESVQNGMNDMTANNENTTETNSTTTNNTVYNVERTDATTDARFAGMTANGWTWFIVAVLGVLIVALVWYFGKQYSAKRNHND